MNRFKEFRRTPVNRDKSSSKIRKSPKKRPGITQIPHQPRFSPGEDAISSERHNKLLKTEFKKTRRNSQLINELMDRSFALRRQTILEHPLNLQSIFDQFPFLHTSDQV